MSVNIDGEPQSLAEWEQMLKDNDKLQRENFFKHIRKRARRSWDIKDLKTDYGPLVPVFVYDSLMRTREDCNILEEFCYMGEATTTEDIFVLMRTSENIMMFPQIPVVKDMFNFTNQSFKRVQGELYGVPLDMLMNLDNMFMNGHEYARWEIPVHLHQYQGQIIGLKHVPTYIGIFDHWKKLHDKGNSDFQLQLCPTRASKHSVNLVYRAYSDNPSPLVAPTTDTQELFEVSYPYGNGRGDDVERWRENYMS